MSKLCYNDDFVHTCVRVSKTDLELIDQIALIKRSSRSVLIREGMVDIINKYSSLLSSVQDTVNVKDQWGMLE